MLDNDLFNNYPHWPDTRRQDRYRRATRREKCICRTISLDDERWKYYNEIGYDEAEASRMPNPTRA